MRRFALVLVLALLSMSGGRRVPAPSLEIDPVTLTAIRRALNEKYGPFLRDRGLPELPRIEVSRVESQPDLYFALCDTEDHWWGDFYCFRFAEGRIDWLAETGERWGNECDAYGVSIRGLRLRGFEGPIVELFESSHMGNGSLKLYELRERRLHMILKTYAVGHYLGFDEDLVYPFKCLKPTYSDLDRDGYTDLTLQGTVERIDLATKAVVETLTVRDTFLWDPVRSCFHPPGRD